MFATQALTLSDVATVAGLFFGMLVGVVWMAGQGGFEPKGLWWKPVLRYLLGIAIVLFIRSGLKIIFPSGENALAYFFGYLRYMVIGFWVTGGAPWIFILANLAEKLHNPIIKVV